MTIAVMKIRNLLPLSALFLRTAENTVTRKRDNQNRYLGYCFSLKITVKCEWNSLAHYGS